MPTNVFNIDTEISGKLTIGGTSDVVISTTGNFGIGTASPSAKLDVVGSIGVTSGNTFGFDNYNGSIYMDSIGRGLLGKFGGSGYARNLIKSDGSATVHIGDNTSLISRILLDAGSSGANGYISLLTKQTERVRIDSNGNVGIGTTAPDYKLHVEGNVGITEYLQHSGDNNTYLRFSGDMIRLAAGGVEMIRLFEDPTQDALIINEAGADVDFRVESDTDTHALFLEGSSGNLGIGTTAPASTLDVNGDIAVKGNPIINRTSNALTIGDIGNADDIGSITLSTANDNTVVHLDDSGSVGIGTTDPKAALDVKGRFLVDSKSMTITNSFNDALTVVMSDHTGCYVKITAFGDWSSHSSISYLGEFFLNNGAGGYNEPGLIIRQIDGTASDAIEAQIVDPGGTTGDREFIIQLRATATASFTAYLTYNIQGMFVSAS